MNIKKQDVGVWVKASKEPVPFSTKEEISFHVIIENEEGLKTNVVVWHLSQDYYKNVFTMSYYKIPSHKVEWLKPVEGYVLTEKELERLMSKYANHCTSAVYNDNELLEPNDFLQSITIR